MSLQLKGVDVVYRNIPCIRLHLDLLAELWALFGGHFDAVAVYVVLPAVIGAAQTALLVSTEPK